MYARLCGRHTHYTHERAQRDRVPQLVAPLHRVGVERPDQGDAFFAHAEAVVSFALPAARSGIAKGAGAYFIDVYAQDHTRLRAAYLDRATQRMASVKFGITRLKFLAWSVMAGESFDTPGRIKRAILYRITRLYCEYGSQVSREVAVQRAALRLDIVGCHAGIIAEKVRLNYCHVIIHHATGPILQG